MQTGIADLPLHYGNAPRWLFERMVRLSRPISEIIINEYGKDEFLKRISNPYFFQAFGCVLGFDWHSSGLTTTTTGALKISLKDLGVEMAGGKGKTSKKTGDDLLNIGEKFGFSTDKIEKLKYASKISAKVDNNLLQAGYQLYHHAFFVSDSGKWAVVQQGMQDNSSEGGEIRGFARRYHWLSDDVQNFVVEPESAIVSEKREDKVLNLVSKESEETQKISLDLIKENPCHLRKFDLNAGNQKQLLEFTDKPLMCETLKLNMPARHEILKIDLGNFDALEKAYEIQPKTYEELVMIKGMGAKTLRALALISSLIYGSSVSWKDPARFSFAHGGKDGIPYPVDKPLYDSSIEMLNHAINSSKVGYRDKLDTLRRFKSFFSCELN